MEFVLWLLVFWFWHGIGITLGYHRILTHQAAKAPKWFLHFLVIGGYLAMQGPPIPWVAVHRKHHSLTETIEDPHSPVYHGFWHAFLAWMWRDGNPKLIGTTGGRPAKAWSSVRSVSCERWAPDLMDDGFLMLLGKDHFPSNPWRNLTSCIVFRLLLLYFCGPVIALASFVAWWTVFFSPQLINTICHMERFGFRTYQTNDNSRNVNWLAPFTFGEAWHNNHHEYPGRAFHGEPDSQQFDVTWEVIKVLEKVGLLTDVRRK